MNVEQIRPRISKNLKNLFLDPNNYRFVDNEPAQASLRKGHARSNNSA